MELVFNRGLHQLIWSYLADNPECNYIQAITNLQKDGVLVGAEVSALLEDTPGNGIACSYALDCLYDTISKMGPRAVFGVPNFCAWCPFDGLRVVQYGTRGKSFSCMNGIYDAWADAQNFLTTPLSFESPSGKLLREKLVRIYAIQIANWPVKDDVVCIG